MVSPAEPRPGPSVEQTPFQPITGTLARPPRVAEDWTPGGANLSSASKRLGQVADRFTDFYRTLENEKQQKRQIDASRYTSLSELTSKVEAMVVEETSRRRREAKETRDHLDKQLEAMDAKFTKQLGDMQAGLKASLDSLSRTFAELHNGLKQESEQRRMDIEHLAQGVAAKLDETRQAIDDEKVSRLEREAQILKRTGEDIFRLQEKIDGETTVWEAALQTLHTEIHGSITNRTGADEKFHSLILGEMASLKNKLQMEQEQRRSEDEQIVLAINAYTKALQDGLRIVNTA